MAAVVERNDYETAEAVRDGVLPSPTKYGDSWFFDLRITGTGAAYRDALEEWAFRHPELWLSDEFVQRCNGLPVIFEHPDRSGLNHAEFRERTIGTIRIPYIKGDEVWGIAQIYDSDAAVLMQTTHRSTSPGVTPPKGSEATELKDGTKVLAEGLPLILDHLAVCENGVWDKDGPPGGIRLDAQPRKDLGVDEDLEKLKKERDDAKSRADSAEKELADMKRADAARKDAEEKERDDAAKADKAKKDAEEADKEAIMAAEKEKADKAKKDARKDRHSKHDGDIMDCSRCDSEEFEEKEKDDKAKKDAAAQKEIEANRAMEINDSRVKALETEIATLRSALAPPTLEDADMIAKAFLRADSICQLLGEQTPHAMPGEKPLAYRRRLANRLRSFTDSWKNYAFHDSQQAQDFDLVEAAIYREAAEHSKKAVDDKPGFLREIRDSTSMHGKLRSTFVGDHRAAWLPFMQPAQTFITGFADRARAGRGA